MMKIKSEGEDMKRKKKVKADFIPLKTFALITGAKNLKEVKAVLKAEVKP